MTFSTLFFLLLHWSAAPVQTTPIEGTWKPIKFEAGGYETGDVGVEIKLMIVGNQFTFLRAENTESGTFTLSENKIDFFAEEGPFKGKHRKAIYELKKDRLFLTISTNDDYPPKMSTAGNTAAGKFTYKREK